MAKNKPRTRMPISERAKQFAPFSPLNGLEKALAEKERIYMPRRILDPEAVSELSDTLSNIVIGDTVTAFFYDEEDKTYIRKTGIAVFVDSINKYIKISDVTVPFDTLYEINIENDNLGE